MRVVLLMNIANPRVHKNVVHARVGEFGDGRIFFDFVEIAQQVAAPGARMVQVPVSLDERFELRVMVHSSSLPFWNCFGYY